jgi:hypothetical protein
MQPGESLIRALERLRARLNSSGTERTAGLLEAMGNDCSFYRKSLDILLDRDYDELERLVEEVNKEFNRLKGTN